MNTAMYDEDAYVFERRHSLDDVLLPSEEIDMVAPISSGIYWKSAAMVIIAVIALFYAGALAFYFALIASIMMLTAYTTQRFLMLAVTNQRIIVSGGFFSSEVIYLPFSKVEGVEVVRSPMGMLFGYSSLILTGTGRMRINVPFVENAGWLADDIAGRTMEWQAAVLGSHTPAPAAAVAASA